MGQYFKFVNVALNVVSDKPMGTRTAAASAALAVKRALPEGWVSFQTTIALPPDLADRWRNATPTDRGRWVEAGVKAIERSKRL